MLTRDRSRGWVIESLGRVREKLDCAIFAYVIMPEHVHVLLRPRRAEYEMSAILAAIKRPVSRQAKEYLIETGQTRWLKKLMVRRGEREVFRFWLPGGGFDRNLWNDKPIAEAIEYIHLNPVRRGLVARAEDWEWSSAGFWSGKRPARLEMDPIR